MNKKLVLIIVMLVILAGTAFFFFTQYLSVQKELQTVSKDPSVVTKLETEALIKEVGRLINLPKDEIPTVITVIDENKLKNQPFFADVENGDKLLLYTKSKKAVLYRPSSKKIINAGNLSVDQPTQVPTQTTPTPVPTK